MELYFTIHVLTIVTNVDMNINIDSGTRNVEACTQLRFALQAGSQSC